MATKNRILDAYIATHRADPADAELRIVVRPEHLTSGTEIKGRLMGPRSPYAGTVEIAYPFRELARTDHVLLRVLIPEPNFWEPKTPLLYEGPLELWQDGERCEQIWLRHGIRTAQLAGQGLRVNGKRLALQGAAADAVTEHDARRWHGEGINLILVPARDDMMELWKITDRFGLFVLGRIDAAHQWPRWPLACQRYPSFLGCVIAPHTVLCQADMAAGMGLLGAEVGVQGEVSSGRYDFALLGGGQQATMTMPTIVEIVSKDEPPVAEGNVLGWLRRNS